MSILIKDMEMPYSCESCPCKTANAFGGLGCQATGYIPLREANQDRPDNCPLIPVPRHGQLIDADALMQSLGITNMECNKCAWYDGEWSRCKRGGDFEDACFAIENAPAIIPAEPAREEKN